MYRRFLISASLLGALAVIMGAFGAHGLKPILGERIEIYETGIRYHFYHTFALLFVLSIFRDNFTKPAILSSTFFCIGILLFSGSLYLLSCNSILGIEHWKWLGPITPIGGLFFILAWLSLLWSAIKKT